MDDDLTQPVDDPRKNGKHLSEVSDQDLADVICLLHPQSNSAQDAVRATMLVGPQHVLENDDLEGLSEFDLGLPQYQETRNFALRLSSKVMYPREGFVFGRNPLNCDLLLTSDATEKLVSNKHFKIYVNNHGSLMLQDLSTNGTMVDDQHLRAKRRDAMQKPPTMALRNGTIISVVSGSKRAEVKFLVRIPNRGAFKNDYERNLRQYLEARGTVANFASMHESQYGNHWDGGELYNFTGNLGSGAFATVYRVQTKREGIPYAAKELDKRRFIKNGILDVKFDNELRIMQNLKHPNIVTYVDYQSYENWVYIIMEQIPHGELSSELRSRGSLPEREVQQITRQIMRALYYLHQRGVTHRDIKPDNILIASKDPLIVKLSDFGLSKCVTDQQTFLKTFCGTLLYCAPEVYPEYNTFANGSVPKRRRLGEPPARPSPYDESVDIWSFGAVIFHLLCGKAPITGRGDDRGAQMLSNIMTKEVDFTPLKHHGVSKEGIDFIASLLNRDPSARPREPECLRHPWLRDVPDLVEYESGDNGADLFRRALESVEEAPEHELDDEMLQQLSQQHQSSSSPQRARKRVKADNGPAPSEVKYPSLPTPVGSSSMEEAPPLPKARLFGEISESVRKSSGLFGMDGLGGPFSIGPAEEFASEAGANPSRMSNTREIQYGLENISVNDFMSRDSEMSLFHDQSGVAATRRLAGASSSLLGAEQQIGNLNVTSPAADVSEVETPERTNPTTPHRRELSPSRKAAVQGLGGMHTESLELDISEDDAENIQPFATDPTGHVGEHVGMAVQKAETFHVRGGTYDQIESPPLARTIDGTTGRISQKEATPIDNEQDERHVKRRTGPSDSNYGTLRSVPGSYVDVEIPLSRREIYWGRSPANTVRYADNDDILIARHALKVVFWTHSIDVIERAGGDWTSMAGIHTIISTSTSAYIRVNGVKLRKQSDDGHNFLYGKLYNGDEITMVDESQGQGKFLRLKVEILLGHGAGPRPATEAPFEIMSIRNAYWKQHKASLSKRELRPDQEDTTGLATSSDKGQLVG
jgi:serine/threonine protein kinase